MMFTSPLQVARAECGIQASPVATSSSIVIARKCRLRAMTAIDGASVPSAEPERALPCSTASQSILSPQTCSNHSSRTAATSCSSSSSNSSSSTASPLQGHGIRLGRRALLAAVAAVTISPHLPPSSLTGFSPWGVPAAAAATAAPPATIRLDLAPDPLKYDAADPSLREASKLLRSGLQAGDVVQEEQTWTQVINTYQNVDKPWAADVVGRAWGNRGNARSRQGRLEEALQDYNTAIQLCPWSPDPVLNRGVVLEALGRWEEAVRDYRAVLEVSPDDPAAWNNLGNATAGLGGWAEAAGYYRRAAQLAPEFSFAAANLALAQYQLGKTNEAVKTFRALLRRYPDFPDMRAALAAALWADGLEAQAESSWVRVDDPRYKDKEWLRTNRRWPPKLLAALEAFLDVRSLPKAA